MTMDMLARSSAGPVARTDLPNEHRVLARAYAALLLHATGGSLAALAQQAAGIQDMRSHPPGIRGTSLEPFISTAKAAISDFGSMLGLGL